MDSTAFAYAGLTGNALIDRLGTDVSRRLLAFSRMVRLEARETLYEPGEAVRHVYFPAGCVAASCASAGGGASVETALVGREGLVGLAAVLGERRATELACAVLPGDAARVDAAALRVLFAESEPWRRLVLSFYGAHVRQVSRRAVCNTRHRLNERLATWLLALCGRSDSDDLQLTQETAARQLGVRRAGVNECVAYLDSLGAVEHSRGRLRVLSREALAGAACSCHAPLSEEARGGDNIRPSLFKNFPAAPEPYRRGRGFTSTQGSKSMRPLAVRQEEVGNLLLASLPPEEFGRLAPLLARVGLEAGERLYEPDEVVPFIHFTEGGLLSLLSTLEDGASIEVGALGREGVGGLLALLGSDAAAHTAVVRVGATALRVGTAQARECFEHLPGFRARVLRYSRLLMSQISQTTLCNTLHTVEQRLARWLMLARMRLGSDTVPVTHELLSHMLGVRRSGVTVAVGVLEEAGLVGHGRGFVRVEDASRLGAASCDCYGLLADEYGNFINNLAAL